MKTPKIRSLNEFQTSKTLKNRNLLETLSFDENLKYLYKLNKNYYYIRKFKTKLYKICLHTSNLIKAIEYKNMIDNKFNLKPNLSVNFNPQTNEISIKKEENDTDEDVINFLQKFNQNQPQIPQNQQLTKLSINDIIEQFIDNQIRIKKRKVSYITELNSSFKYLKFFIDEYKITKIENLNSDFFEEIQEHFLYNIPKRFFSSQYKNLTLEELKKKDLQEEEKFNNKTINKHFIFFSVFIKYLIRKKYILNNPINIEFLEEIDAHKEPFLIQELHNIFLQFKTKKENINYYKFLLYTGMRTQELSHLKIKDIEEKFIIIPTSKTSSGIRLIPIHKKLIEIIKEQKKGKKLTDFLFFQGDFQKNQKNLNSLLHENNLSKTLHSFRKNFTQQLYKQKLEEVYIKVILGHSNQQNLSFTTYNREKIDEEYLYKIVNKINFNEENEKIVIDINVF